MLQAHGFVRRGQPFDVPVGAGRFHSVSAQYPARERRKQQTRAALIDSAVDLFSKRGYEDTTLEQIADHAGLHVQTLYRHFPSKPHLATAVDQSRMDEFSQAILDPARTDTTFEFWREWIQLSVRRLRKHTRGLARYRDLVRRSYAMPSVSTHVLAMGFEYERLLTKSLAADFDLDPEQYRLPRLVACMLYAANAEVVRRWVSEGGFDLTEEAVAVADEVEELFAHFVKH